jgi:hypothetical protein
MARDLVGAEDDSEIIQSVSSSVQGEFSGSGVS